MASICQAARESSRKKKLGPMETSPAVVTTERDRPSKLPVGLLSVAIVRVACGPVVMRLLLSSMISKLGLVGK